MLNTIYNNIGVVVLAAGKGTRLGCTDIPKAMLELNGKPMVSYIVETLERIGFEPEQIVMVVGFKKEKVKEYFKDRVVYTHQDNQFGTGHATEMAEDLVKQKFEHVIVLYGDMPLLSSDSVKKLIDVHLEGGKNMTLFSATTPDFKGMRTPFNMFGRIIRNDNDDLLKIVEWKDASNEELGIKELSTCIFSFKTKWLFDSLSKIDSKNAQNEKYLVDLVPVAMKDGGVATADISLSEVYGINTNEDLSIVSSILTS